MAKTDLTAERLRAVLDYDPSTGDFTWKETIGWRRQKGSQAGGAKTGNGYLRVGVDGGVYLAHRLAWMHVHGCWPGNHIDHINGNRTDNRITNLRDVPRKINSQNRRKSHIQGRLLGTRWWAERGRWVAKIKKDGRYYHLGLFRTEDEAHAAYVTAKRKLHEGCTL